MLDFETLKPVLTEFAKNLAGIDHSILRGSSPLIQKVFELSPSINREIVEKILPLVSPLSLKRGEHYLSQGEQHCKIALNIQGLFRTYCINDEGEEITIALGQEGDVFASWEPILLNKPNHHYVQALEDSLMFSIDYHGLKDLLKQDLALFRVYHEISLTLLGKGMDMYRSVLNMKPQERYLNLYHHHPELFARASKQVIASYIGVTPVSFSRLKNRLEKELGIHCM